MGQALYRRYRSKNLAEIVGQEHITHTLENALRKGNVGHAYLLTGPRGVGKTSIARILAHEINELPYETEKIHLDIIEIDAASNRRIDEIRDLRDKVHAAPTSAKYKVYIIDEVHMLTKEAFNALLKTLEEPPSHVIFVLATTDVHKLPETIISRTQHFTFRPIAASKVAKHLAQIAKKEKINIDDEAIKLIAEHGGGSFRDSISLLEQAAGMSDDVKKSDVEHMLGVPPQALIEEICLAYENQNAKAIVGSIDKLLEQGYLAEEIAKQISEKLREMLLGNSTGDTQTTALLLEDLIDVPASRDPSRKLEITMLKRITSARDRGEYSAKPSGRLNIEPKKTITKKPTVDSSVKEAEQKVQKTSPDNMTESDKVVQPKEQTEEKPLDTGNVQSKDVDFNEELWAKTLSELKKTHSTLYSVARMAEFMCDADNVVLTFKFPFHKKRMESEKHKNILTNVIKQTTGKSPVVTCVLATKENTRKDKPQAEPIKEENSHLETVSNIFGGGEVLES